MSTNNTQARSLFEWEGYLLIREFWRVALELLESSEGSASYAGKFDIEIDVESGQLVGTTPLYDREGIYSVRQYVTYEKELRPDEELYACYDDNTKTLIRV